MKKRIALFLALIMMVQLVVPAFGFEGDAAASDWEFLSETETDGQDSPATASDAASPSEADPYDGDETIDEDELSDEEGFLFDLAFVPDLASFADAVTPSDAATPSQAATPSMALAGEESSPIVYELDGGTNNEGNPGEYTEEMLPVELLAPSKEGYTFAGWFTDPEKTGENRIEEIAEGTTGMVTVYAAWTPIAYTVKFDGNGASSGKMSSQSRTYDDGLTLTANTFKKTGYTFTGWNTKASGSGTAYGNEDIANLRKTAGTTKLYAQWTTTKYTITYELAGGTNGKNPASYDITTATITLKSPKKTGYTFAGWYSDYKFKKKASTVKKGSTGDKTFYAKWTVNKYSVKFDANGGKGTMKSMTGIAYDTPKALTKNAFKKTGYEFVGWATSKSGSAKYGDKETIEKLSAKDGTAVTLYAVWAKVKYTITYELNEGTNSSKNPATYSITSSTIKLKNATREHYTFGGWYSDTKFKKKVTSIPKGSTGNVKLYAKWTINKYTIAFDANGGKGTMKSLTKVSYGDLQPLTANAFTKAGYEFIGWAASKTGDVVYGDKVLVQNLSDVDGATVTLYAKWKKISYTIQFDGNGAESGELDPIPTEGNVTVTLPTGGFTVTGYEISSWNTGSDGKGTSYAPGESYKNLAKKDGETVKLYAIWQPVSYKIEYKGLGDGKNTKNPSSYTVATQTITLKDPTRTGYTFLGWYGDSDFNTEITTIPQGSTGTVRLYARWQENVYDISYKLNGGTNSKHNPDTYTVATSTDLKDATRTGYTFKGWYSDSGYKKQVKKISKGTTGDKTLYAKWEIKRYDIVYHLDGGTNNSGNPSTYTIADTVKLKSPTKSGYRFGGWYTKSNFDNQIDRISGSTGTIHLYACWKGAVHLIRVNDYPIYTRNIFTNNFYTTMRIDGIKFSYSQNSYNNNYKMTIDFSCVKTDDPDGAKGTWGVGARYMILDEDYNVVDNGTLYKRGLMCGLKFTVSKTIYNIPKGDYYIYLYDYD